MKLSYVEGILCASSRLVLVGSFLYGRFALAAARYPGSGLVTAHALQVFYGLTSTNWCL
jgi:hypothetical protein